MMGGGAEHRRLASWTFNEPERRGVGDVARRVGVLGAERTREGESDGRAPSLTSWAGGVRGAQRTREAESDAGTPSLASASLRPAVLRGGRGRGWRGVVMGVRR